MSAGRATVPDNALATAGVDALGAPAALGSTLELGDEQRLRPPRFELPWQRIALWSVLVNGVAVIAGMALNLYRDMERRRS